MEQWNNETGTIEKWNHRTMEQWNRETMEQWNNGTGTMEQSNNNGTMELKQ